MLDQIDEQGAQGGQTAIANLSKYTAMGKENACEHGDNIMTVWGHPTGAGKSQVWEKRGT